MFVHTTAQRLKDTYIFIYSFLTDLSGKILKDQEARNSKSDLDFNWNNFYDFLSKFT